MRAAIAIVKPTTCIIAEGMAPESAILENGGIIRQIFYGYLPTRGDTAAAACKQ